MPAPASLSICRFAPSPNGALHLGHAYSALRNRQVADRLGGRLLLRMEDIDLARCSPAKAAAIEADLAWLGVAVDGPVRRQSEHFALYDAALGRLAARDLVYPCFCARGDILRAVRDAHAWPCDPDGSSLYPGTCRSLSAGDRAAALGAGRPHALRLDMARALGAVGAAPGWEEYDESEVARAVAGAPAAWGDAVVRRRDIPASYHIAVVVDDAAQGVTDVVRGRDLFAATSLHRLLQVLLGLPAPRYHHHRLLRDGGGEKLSKSRDATALADLRRAGLTPGDIRRLIDERLAA